MGLFRRRPRGRHALGAAVVGLPSGPPPAWEPEIAPTVPPLAAVPDEDDLLGSIAALIATGEAWAVPHDAAAPLVAPESTALAPAAQSVPIPAVLGAPLPAVDLTPPAAALAVSAEPEPSDPLTVSTWASVDLGLPAAPEAVPVEPPPPAPEPPSARARLAELLAGTSGDPLLERSAAADVPATEVVADSPAALPLCAPPVEAALAYVPEQPGPRVELGFRDGSTASLDPGSEQALALAELSSMLTGRD